MIFSAVFWYFCCARAGEAKSRNKVMLSEVRFMWLPWWGERKV